MVEYLSGNRIQGSSTADGDFGTGLKAYYKFNESSGNIVNVANTITGNSTLGTGQNITMNGDPTYSVTGTPSSFGNAVSCDGSGDYGQFGTKTDWNFLHTTGATWTINVWLKFDASVVANKQLFDNTQTADSTIGLNIRTQSSNRFRVIIPRGVGNSSTLDTDNNPNLPIPTDNAWHMYTFRWDQSSGNGVLTYNRDGANELTKNGSGNGTTTSDCTDSPRLFSQSNSVSGELDSEIAEMSIFNTVITDAEVTRLYNSGSGRLLTKAGSADEKDSLTSVPLNARYEETDTRKIYRRAIPSSPEATKNYVYGTSQVPAGANATVSIGDSGTKMYLTSNSASDSQKGYQYTLSTAYDVSTASYASKSYQFGSQSGDTRGMKWKNNGIYCYKMSDQTGNKAIYRYTASTAWDISTLGSNQSYTYSSVQTGGKDMDLSSDGTKMYALADNATIYQYTLSTAWQVSSGVSSASKSHSCQSQDNAPRNFQITNSGTKLRYLGSQYNKLYTYTLSTAWDISTASYDGADSDIDCNTFTDNPYGVWCKDDFSWLAIGSVDSPYDVQQFDKDPVWKERGTA